jgi:uncharacterized membrane protein
MSLRGEVVGALATACTAIALLVFVVGAVRSSRHPRQGVAELVAAIGLTLEFLLAGGLLRLSSTRAWTALAVAALIVVVRKVVGAGLAAGLRAVMRRPPRRGLGA